MYLHVYLPTVVDINLFKCIPENEARFQELVLKVRPEIFFTDVSPILLFSPIANIPEQLFFCLGGCCFLLILQKITQPTPRYLFLVAKSLKSIHPLHQPSSPTNILLRSQKAKLPYYIDRLFLLKSCLNSVSNGKVSSGSNAGNAGSVSGVNSVSSGSIDNSLKRGATFISLYVVMPFEFLVQLIKSYIFALI